MRLAALVVVVPLLLSPAAAAQQPAEVLREHEAWAKRYPRE
jgi:hypothetical protein